MKRQVFTNINVDNENESAICQIKQGTAMIITMELFENGVPFIIPPINGVGSYLIRLGITRPDGSKAIQTENITYDKNLVMIDLASGVTSVPGRNRCDITISKVNGTVSEIVTTASFYIDVIELASSDLSPDAGDYIPDFDKIIVQFLVEFDKAIKEVNAKKVQTFSDIDNEWLAIKNAIGSSDLASLTTRMNNLQATFDAISPEIDSHTSQLNVLVPTVNNLDTRVQTNTNDISVLKRDNSVNTDDINNLKSSSVNKQGTVDMSNSLTFANKQTGINLKTVEDTNYWFIKSNQTYNGGVIIGSTENDGFTFDYSSLSPSYNDYVSLGSPNKAFESVWVGGVVASSSAGECELTNNIIAKWGVVELTINPSTYGIQAVSFPFPRAFEKTTLNVEVTPDWSGSSTCIFVLGLNSFNANTVSVWVQKINTTDTKQNKVRLRYYAIGN
ncbi:MAG: hypothetical protein ACRC28_18700 [Clostridium sp.]|uniref:hypothetical protein n=1 Tax=Clostridium sp. TaxID=1506 RepID=UPI003F3600B8